MIKENIEKVHQRVLEACRRINVDPSKVMIVCVAKGRPVEEILEVVNLGINQIGENRVQEAEQKHNLVPQAHWQMVGHLQSNKVKDALRIFDLIHSVDTLDLAREINRQAAKINKHQDILLEVKTSGEVSKFGFKPELLGKACDEIIKFQNVRIKGLMTIAPEVDNTNAARPYFSKLKQLRDQLNPEWSLSMGMSSDFEAAIEEGADIIRLGRVIFEK